MGWGWSDGATGHHGTHPAPTQAGSMRRMRIWLPPPGPGSYLGTERKTWVRSQPAHSPPLAPAPRPLPLTGSLGMRALPGQSRWALEAAPGPGHCSEEVMRQVSASPHATTTHQHEAILLTSGFGIALQALSSSPPLWSGGAGGPQGLRQR